MSAIAGFANCGVGKAETAAHEVFGVVNVEIGELGEFCFVDQDFDIAAVEVAIALLGFSVEGEAVDKVKTSTGYGLQAHVASWFGVVPLDAFDFLGGGG